MRRQRRFHILVAAAAVLAPLAMAHADEENFISTANTGYFQRMAAMPKTGADQVLAQHRHVTRTPLLWEIVTYDNVPPYGAPPGAQGPIREFNPEATAVHESEDRLWQQMYPIGGMGTP